MRLMITNRREGDMASRDKGDSMNRIFLREEDETTGFSVYEKYKIGVLGMSCGAGATFVATSLAKAFSRSKEKRTAFLEMSGCLGFRSGTYDALGMDKRFAGREFVDFYKVVKGGGSVKGLLNIDERINWALRVPSTSQEDGHLTPYERMRLISNISGDIIICDFDVNSFAGNLRELENILEDMDSIIFVINPLPSGLLAGHEVAGRMKELENKGRKVINVVNKYNSGINKSEFLNYMKLKNYIAMPYASPEHIYAAEYNCRIPYAHKDIEEKISKGLLEIVKLHQISF